MTRDEIIEKSKKSRVELEEKIKTMLPRANPRILAEAIGICSMSTIETMLSLVGPEIVFLALGLNGRSEKEAVEITMSKGPAAASKTMCLLLSVINDAILTVIPKENQCHIHSTQNESSSQSPNSTPQQGA